jgi:hypothetical protein
VALESTPACHRCHQAPLQEHQRCRRTTTGGSETPPECAAGCGTCRDCGNCPSEGAQGSQVDVTLILLLRLAIPADDSASGIGDVLQFLYRAGFPPGRPAEESGSRAGCLQGERTPQQAAEADEVRERHPQVRNSPMLSRARLPDWVGSPGDRRGM